MSSAIHNPAAGTETRPLAQALADAEEFRALFPPACYERWEFAGSVRRRPAVGDVEHVVIPKTGEVPGDDLFGTPDRVNLLWHQLDALLRTPGVAKHVYGTNPSTGAAVHRWGEKYRGVDFRGFNHEIFTADADNWGSPIARTTSHPVQSAPPPAAGRVASPVAARAPRPAPPASANGDASGISARQQRMLDAAATLTTLGVDVTRETVCGWLGIHPRGGSVGEELKALSDAGLVVVDRGTIHVTDAGMDAAEQMDPATAIDRAKGGLSPRQRRIFDIVAAAHPDEVTRDAVAEQMGIHPRGGSFGEDIARLAGRGLIESGRGVMRARDFLFAVPQA